MAPANNSGPSVNRAGLAMDAGTMQMDAKGASAASTSASPTTMLTAWPRPALWVSTSGGDKEGVASTFGAEFSLCPVSKMSTPKEEFDLYTCVVVDAAGTKTFAFTSTGTEASIEEVKRCVNRSRVLKRLKSGYVGLPAGCQLRKSPFSRVPRPSTP